MPYLLALRAHWKLLVGGLLLAAVLVQTIRLERSERRADKLEFSLREAHAALKEAHDAAVAQQAETERLMKLNRERQTQAGDKAKRIENAPLPGNCKTPQSIMDLDI